LARGEETDLSGQADVIHRDDLAMAFMSIDWIVGNEGHVLVVPVAHHEHLYDLPDALGSPLQHVVRRVALALKRAYGCDGVSVLQNNEPDGSQDVWHYHAHVFPRYHGDNFRRGKWKRAPEHERRVLALGLRAALDQAEATGSETFGGGR
jgi:histidine triad (HIT) family protein